MSFPTQPEEVEVDLEKPITLEQAVELSLKNNEDVQAAKIQVEQSQDALREAEAALFPTFDLSSGLSYSDSAFHAGIDSMI